MQKKSAQPLLDLAQQTSEQLQAVQQLLDTPPQTTPTLRPPQSWKTLNNHYHAVLTHPWYRRLARIQHEMQAALHRFFTSQGLITVSMPITTSSISSPMGLGSDSLPVEVDLFGVQTYLADSMQFMLELGCRLHEQGVYYIMPCFRGEQTDRYHLPQFYHVEAEIPGTLPDVIELASEMIHQLSSWMLERCADTLEQIAGNVEHIERVLALGGHYPRIRMDEAIDILQQGSNGECWVQRHPAGFSSITRSGETELVRRNGGNPLWLTHFDHLAVPFYQAYEEGSGKALNADLLLGTCETVGSGQRHLTGAQVQAALRQHSVSPQAYAWYLQMRDEAPLETSGFGMGLERYLLWLLQHDDIRDIPLLYRENGVSVVP